MKRGYTRCRPAQQACYTSTFQTFLAARHPEWAEYLGTQLTADEKTTLYAMPAVQAIRKLMDDHRVKMAGVEATFQSELGKPWTSMRFYSGEEQADDAIVSVLRSAKLELDDGADMFLVLMRDTRNQCESVAASGPIPYGRHYADDHHGTCWRVGHQRQLAKLPSPDEPALVDDGRVKLPRVPQRAQSRRPIY